MRNIKGKHFWVIGASSGIGRALCLALAAEGAYVTVSARRDDELQKLANEMSGGGHSVIPFDASDSSMIKVAADKIMAGDKPLDSVIYMAAIYSANMAEQNDLAFIKKTLDVNLMGMFHVIQSVLPYFKGRHEGQIVMTGSVAGYRGLPKGQPYSFTKAAVINYAESLKIELEPHNIDVRVISPGFVKTDMTAKNNFDMPMMIGVDEAARDIVKGLKSNAFEIHFPKQFTFIMKLLDVLPRSLYFWLMRQQFKQSEQSK